MNDFFSLSHVHVCMYVCMYVSVCCLSTDLDFIDERAATLEEMRRICAAM